MRRVPAPYRQTAAEVLRYLVAGTAITLASQAIYEFGLATGLEPRVAFALSFLCGTGAGYLIHSRFVFRTPARRHHWFSFPLSYLLRFLAGEGLLMSLLRGGMGASAAGLVTNLFMAPIGFLMLRLVLRAEGLWLPRAGRKSEVLGDRSSPG